MVEELRNDIGGRWTDTAFDRRSELIDPSTGEVFASAPVSSETEVDAAFASAAEAFPGWRDTTPGERSLAQLRIADAIETHADELVKAESQNTGKPIALTLSKDPADGLTRSGSSQAPPGCWRAARRVSTCPGSPRSSGVSRSGCAPR